MLYNLEAKTQFTEADFRRRFPDVGFPETIETHNILEYGYVVIDRDPAPAIGPGETLEPGDLRIEGNEVFQSWVVVPATASKWAPLIAARRYEAEVSGTTVSDIPIDTGRDSQGLITGAAVQAIIDPEYSLHWKTSGGFIELSGAQVLGVASAVRAHVQACFNREAELLDAVADGSITAEMLDQGWPS